MLRLNIGLVLTMAVAAGCATTGPTRDQIMSREIINRAFKSNAVAANELNHFVFEFDPRSDTVPKCIDPLVTADFVRQQLQKATLDPEEARQIAELADFYNLKQLVPDFLKTLVRQEMTEQRYLVAIAFTYAVGVLGDGDAWVQGQDYFHFLLSSSHARSRIPELLACLNAFTPKENSQATAKRLESLIQMLQGQAANDPQAGIEMRTLQDLQNNTLPRIIKAAEMKNEILAVQHVAVRSDRLVAIYLKLSMHYHDWLDRWAVRMLLRERYLNGPAEAVEAFQRALEKADGLGKPEEAKKTLKRVCCHGIDFFGGSLTEEEQKDIQKLAPQMAGLLSLDPQCPRVPANAK